jgi:hypothetical protein
VNNPRETIAAALFSLLAATQINSAPAFATTGRRAKIWGDVDPSKQPAMFLIHSGEQAVQSQPFGLTKWLLHFEVLIYLRVDPSPTATPDTAINAFLDAIDAQMQSGSKGTNQTLGGLVTNAWIEGSILIDSGILDQQVAMLIPLKVVTGI